MGGQLNNFDSGLFNLDGKVIVITGGGGLLGYQHAAAVASHDGRPVLLDISIEGLKKNKELLEAEFNRPVLTIPVDITDFFQVQESLRIVLDNYSLVNVLINNAARNPKVGGDNEINFSRLENFPIEQWQFDLNVGLGGAFNCSKVYGAHMANAGLGGVIINVASDLGIIAPDQRLYRVEGLAENLQPVKPVTYSVVKHGLIGLTKYLATYWCDKDIRCNTISPGGVYVDQSDQFVVNLSKLIPLGRMAKVDEYRGAIIFLASDASSYLNGANLVIDGGRSVW